MDWWQTLLVILLSLIALMLVRVPVAFAFMLVNIAGAIFLWGGESGLRQLIMSIENSLTLFSLVPISMFVLMGEIMFYCGIANKLIDTTDKWIGKLPGRLSLLSVGGGTLLSTLTGSSVSSTVILGSVLMPEMQRRGYKSPMTMGPIMGSGGLAVMIPPSALGVLLASIAKISIGDFLIAIIIPGIMMALFFAVYIVVRAKLQPDLAPVYEVEKTPLKTKLILTAKYILPLGIIVFLVIGLIFLGMATPTEAAAMGAFGSMVMAAFYRQLTWGNMVKAFASTVKVSVMILMIVAGSSAFGQILSFSGATRELVHIVAQLPLSSLSIVLMMLLVVLFMGCFMEATAIMMVVFPIFIPIAQALGIDLIWLGVMILIALELGAITPPFGLGLFAMKSVAPAGTTMTEVYKAALPFIFLQLAVIVVIMIFPEIATWLPSFMKK